MAKKNSKSSPKNKGRKNLFLTIISIIVLVLFVLYYVTSSFQTTLKSKKADRKEAKASNQEFRIDGKLDFFNSKNDTITSIFIEIAEDNYSREKGLMHRYTIPDTVGMLFVFPEEDYHSFWMKNTPSSLDILYVDASGKIIRIFENTQPYSEESIPSGDMAQYVVEVKAGFCSIHRVTLNDRIEFVRYR